MGTTKKLGLADENKKLKHELEVALKQNVEIRRVLADVTDALVLATQKKNLLRKAQTVVKAHNRAGGKMGLISDEIKYAHIQRDVEEKGHLYYATDGKTQKEKNFLDKPVNKLRELLEDPDVKISADISNYSIGKEKPEILTAQMIFSLIEKVNKL